MAIVKTQNGGEMTLNRFYRTNFYFRFEGQVGITGISWQFYTGTTPGPDLGDFALLAQQTLDSDFQTVVPIQVKILGCKAFELGPKSVVKPLPGIATSTSTGSDADPGMPSAVSGLISQKSLLSGRKFRGRMYMPFPSVLQMDNDDSPTALYVTRLDSLWTDAVTLITTITTGFANATVRPVIYHKSDNTGTDISEAHGRKLWATQHRRGNFGQLNQPVIS